MKSKVLKENLKRVILPVLQEKSFKKLLSTLIKEEFESEKILYHVTYLGLLDSIAENGLRLGKGERFGGGYTSHSIGRIFFTEADGIRVWFGKYEDMAQHSSDNPLEDGKIPVVLRVDVSGLNLTSDELGTRDATYDAYFATENVSSERISVYSGNNWESVTSVDIEEMQQIAQDASEFEEQEDDEEPLIYPNFEIFFPR
jgi:hypothetical protein